MDEAQRAKGECGVEACIKYSTNSYHGFIFIPSTIVYHARQRGTAGNKADTMSTSGEPSQVKIRCFVGMDTGHWAEDLGNKSHTQPSLGREGLVFLLARSLTC